MTFEIELNQDCIDRGRPGSSTSCPIAKALIEQAPFQISALDVFRRTTMITIPNPGKGSYNEYNLQNDSSIRRWIKRFDDVKLGRAKGGLPRPITLRGDLGTRKLQKVHA